MNTSYRLQFLCKYNQSSGGILVALSKSGIKESMISYVTNNIHGPEQSDSN
jgi:hypothetical protein